MKAFEFQVLIRLHNHTPMDSGLEFEALDEKQLQTQQILELYHSRMTYGFNKEVKQHVKVTWFLRWK